MAGRIARHQSHVRCAQHWLLAITLWMTAIVSPAARATHAIVGPPDLAGVATHCHDANEAPWAGGATPTTPGMWEDVDRGNVGWDFFYSDDRGSLKVFLYTYTHQGRPIWLVSKMAPLRPDGTWIGRFYKYTASNSTGTEVGSVALSFLPDDPTKVLVNWDWDELRTVTPSIQTECVSDIVEISPFFYLLNPVFVPRVDRPHPLTPAYPGVLANELFSGFWDTNGAVDGAPGFVTNIVQNTYVDIPTEFVEADVLLTYDGSATAEPVWLFGDMATDTTNCTGEPPDIPCSPPPLNNSGNLLYFEPKICAAGQTNCYHHTPPTETCTPPQINACAAPVQTVGTVSRNITNGIIGTTATLTATVTTSTPIDYVNSPPQPQTLVSANFFPQGAPTIHKITNSTGIRPVQLSCRIQSPAQTCTIYVPWNASFGTPTPYRHNLGESIEDSSYLQLATTQTGEVYDQLTAGMRVMYELWQGTPGTPGSSIVDQSPEVRAYSTATPAVGDSSDGTPATPPSPAAFSEPTPPSTAADSVGAIAADFRVDEGGDATYRIPLVVAVGSGGFAPKLALTYTSGGGNGYYGSGVALEGTSAIVPCRPGKEYGDTDVPTSTASSFCLDGQRLLLQTGTDRAVNAVYRTEIETFQKVVLENSQNLTVGSGTLVSYTFAVYGKDGTVRRYGGANGTVASLPTGSAQPVPTAWQQYELRDATNNVITYNYDPITTDSERKLRSITYVGGQITFSYQAGGGVDSSYSNVPALRGAPTVLMGRIQRSSLVTAINVSSTEGFLRHYTLCYQDPFASGACVATAVPQNRARLTSISECADSAGSVCYPATTFDWADQSLAVQSTTNGSALTKFPDLRSYKLGDFDGDHRSDLLWIDGGHHLNVSYSNPTSAGLDFTQWQTIATLNSTFAYDALWEVMDYNGDGIDDVLYATIVGATVQWNVRLGTNARGFGSPTVIIANGGGVLSGQTGQGSQSGASMMADFNGDGLPDLLYFAPGGTYHIALLTTLGSPFAFDATHTVTFTSNIPGVPTCTLTDSQPNVHDAEHSAAIDIDGDGLADTHFILTESNPCHAANPILSTLPDPGGSTIVNGDNTNFYLKTFRSVGLQADGSFKFAMYDWLNVNIPSLFNHNIDAVGARVKVLDINGDGLADLLYRSDGDHHWYYMLAGGPVSFSGPIGGAGCQTIEDTGLLDRAVQITDLNGDGKIDFWCPGGGSGNSIQYQVSLWKGDGFSTTPQTFQLNSASGTDWTRLTGDYDGDGVADLLVVQTDGGWWANRNTSHHAPRNMITSIQNGLGAITEITYAPLTFSSVYRRDYDGPFTYASFGRGSMPFDVDSPNYVAQYVSSSAPGFHAPGDLAVVQYSYRGLKVQGGGRGSLGFRRVAAYDLQTGMRVDTTYSQHFPTAGVALATSTTYIPNYPTDPCLGGAEANQCMSRTPTCAAGLASVCDDDIPTGQSIKLTQDTWQWRTQPTTLVDGHTVNLGIPALPPATASTSIHANEFIARTLSQTFNYDLQNPGQLNSFESTTFDATKFDDTGNPLSAVITKSAGGVAVTSSSAYTYAAGVANWKLGRLLTSTVFNERTSAASNGRKSTFTYDPTTYLLASERVEGMTGTSLGSLVLDSSIGSVTTYYGYDSFGNKNATYTCSTAGIPESTCRGISGGSSFYAFHPTTNGHGITRYTKTDFDATGRFANAVHEGFSNGGDLSIDRITRQITSRDVGGNPKTVVDVNGVTTQMRYGSFGRKFYEWNSTGVSTRYDYSACNAVCPTIPSLSYYVTTTTAGAPSRRTFYDLLGRETISSVQGFASSDYISTLTYYDDRGNLYRKSQPFMAVNWGNSSITPISGASIYWTTTLYDALNRPNQITQPDNGIITVSYPGLATTTTLPANASGLSQTLTQTKDAAGNIVSTVDALSTVVTYAYDGAGNQVSVTHNGITSSATYDTLGRKKTSSDPDTGSRTYVVDDLGQTIQQVTARNTCSQMRIDARGRLWQRSDFPNATCTGTADTVSEWLYDISSFGIGKLSQEDDSVGGVQKALRAPIYNSHSQLIRTNTVIDGQLYGDQTNYDQYGRVFQTFFSTPSYATTGELYEYNAQGYQQDIRSAYPGTTGMVYYQAQAMDAFGHVTSEYRSSMARMLTERTYDLRTGRVTAIQSGGGFTQDLSYDYDQAGNMKWRRDQTGSLNFGGGRNVYEQFTYDKLQRLTGNTLSNGTSFPPILSVAYNTEGNITQKYNSTDVSNTYTYAGTIGNYCQGVAGAAAPGPHAVTQVGARQFCYDADGNMIQSQAGTFHYTPYDLPDLMTSTATHNKIGFEYGPNREKVRRLNYLNENSTSATDVTHFVGAAEIRYVSGSAAIVRRYLGPVVIVQGGNGTDYQVQREYFLTDAQGSTFGVLTDWGEPANAHADMGFDPFGARRSPDDATFPPWSPDWLADVDATTHRGYTGHEEVDAFGIIHMNGRIYDPLIGRFLQADPFVQDVYNSQSLNRYSYVLNNPMTFTDPTGYWGHREQAWLRTIIAIALSVWTGGESLLAIEAGDWGAAAAWAFAGGFASGAVQSGNGKGALVGGLTALAFVGVNYMYASSGGALLSGSSATERYAVQALTAGAAGGVLATMQGQRFGSGFLSAGLGSALNPVVSTASDNDFVRGFVAAIAGGTVSELSGGKFANGAVTAAFSFTLSSIMSSNGGDRYGVTVTGCGSKYGCSPSYLGFGDGETPEYLLPQTDPAIDDAAVAALGGTRPRAGGEWTGYIEFSYPEGQYVASTPQFFAYNDTHNSGLAVSYQIPQDAVAVFHTHPLFPTQAANLVQMPFGPGDANVNYSRGIPNYLRPPIGPISVLEMTIMGPIPRQLTPDTTPWGR